MQYSGGHGEEHLTEGYFEYDEQQEIGGGVYDVDDMNMGQKEWLQQMKMYAVEAASVTALEYDPTEEMLWTGVKYFKIGFGLGSPFPLSLFSSYQSILFFIA